MKIFIYLAVSMAGHRVLCSGSSLIEIWMLFHVNVFVLITFGDQLDDKLPKTKQKNIVCYLFYYLSNIIIYLTVYFDNHFVWCCFRYNQYVRSSGCWSVGEHKMCQFVASAQHGTAYSWHSLYIEHVQWFLCPDVYICCHIWPVCGWVLAHTHTHTHTHMHARTDTHTPIRCVLARAVLRCSTVR